jgi:hypothetical protein
VGGFVAFPNKAVLEPPVGAELEVDAGLAGRGAGQHAGRARLGDDGGRAAIR